MRREFEEKIKGYLDILYKENEKEQAWILLEETYENWKPYACKRADKLSEKDCIMISYGDCIQAKGENPLCTLKRFLDEFCPETISNVHLLPVFPYTSDDGFSVADYSNIAPELGTWEDVRELGESKGIMMDAVINHTSKSHDWFLRCCRGEKPYCDYYIECDPNADYSQVTRPRALPLLTAFDTKEGKKWFWTTFSEDQIDVNFRSPFLLKEIVEVLLLYVKNGARFIRLDAIGFAWKRIGTSCMHLKETHTLVKLLRSFVEELYPGTCIITETNVPHKENISYFGNGDEAHMVYQFPLPPLVFYTMLTQNSEKLTTWAKSLEETPLPEGTTFFNFLASHDGIGVRPVDGILNEEEKNCLLEATLKRGGRISYKQNSDGSKSPYELNISYLNAVTDPKETDIRKKANCFLASQAVILSMQGVPGIYYHSLLGSENWEEGVELSGINRRINREKLRFNTLKEELKQEGTLRKYVFDGFTHMLEVRSKNEAFSPMASQRVLNFGQEIFALERGNKVTILINVTDHNVTLPGNKILKGRNLLQGEEVTEIRQLKPYEIIWLEGQQQG
jgi:glycosidase